MIKSCVGVQHLLVYAQIMQREIRVNLPPPKPLMVFDGDCHFCRSWIARWRQITGEAVDYLPSQDGRVVAQFPEIPRESFTSSVQLILPDGLVYSGAEAVFLALSTNPRWEWPLKVYYGQPFLAGMAERAYGFVARHRTLSSWATRMLWGRQVERPEYFLTRWIFLRALGLIYLVAFVSFWMQASGLIGHNGILPADKYIAYIKQTCDAQHIGLDRFRLAPTLCWLNSSDGFLNFQCAAGTVLAALLVVGLAPMPCLALLWLLYLSLSTVGQDFWGFQWDILLLEAGFLAIFFAPLTLLPRASRENPPSRLVLWLLRALLFKLMFSSGAVKLASEDPNWRNLTALTYHYETQPLPTWISWWANQLPLAFQKFSCAGVFAVELGAPFLILLPRRIRFVGCWILIGFQVLILLTGNYTFFNFLAIALCLLLLDDQALARLTPARIAAWFQMRADRSQRRWPLAVTIPLAVIFLTIALYQTVGSTGYRPAVLMPAAMAEGLLAPLRTFNSYGLFAVMTTERREIVVEGSNDGTNWIAYEFKYKPGDMKQKPRFVEPFQPRLDWQMWFAALGDVRQNPWFENFCVRLLQGSPEVLALLEKNPFPHQPPKYIRAEFYDYHFTTAAERRATGAWWKRELVGEYLPAVSLRE